MCIRDRVAPEVAEDGQQRAGVDEADEHQVGRREAEDGRDEHQVAVAANGQELGRALDDADDNRFK